MHRNDFKHHSRRLRIIFNHIQSYTKLPKSYSKVICSVKCYYHNNFVLLFVVTRSIQTCFNNEYIVYCILHMIFSIHLHWIDHMNHISMQYTINSFMKKHWSHVRKKLKTSGFVHKQNVNCKIATQICKRHFHFCQNRGTAVFIRFQGTVACYLLHTLNTYKTSLKADKEDWGEFQIFDWIIISINDRINERTNQQTK